MCAKIITTIGVNSKMNTMALSQIQQLEMRMHKMADRMGALEHMIQQLVARIEELEKTNKPVEA